jgi:tetratricopeptide (TPR) repeat protein
MPKYTKRKKHKLTPEDSYNKGIVILNSLLTDDLTLMTSDALINLIRQAVNYINIAILDYSKAGDMDNVELTKGLLADFFEEFIADTLYDLAKIKVQSGNAVDAIFYYGKAIEYYGRAIALNDYTLKPVVDLHFSVLHCLQRLIVIDTERAEVYRNKMADYLEESRVSTMVHTNSVKAQQYKTWLELYESITYIKSSAAEPEEKINYESASEQPGELSESEQPGALTSPRKLPTSLTANSFFALTVSPEALQFSRMTTIEQDVINTLFARLGSP